MIPAASGAEADVPVWESVHFCLRSVVTLDTVQEREKHRNAKRNTVNMTHRVLHFSMTEVHGEGKLSARRRKAGRLLE